MAPRFTSGLDEAGCTDNLLSAMAALLRKTAFVLCASMDRNSGTLPFRANGCAFSSTEEMLTTTFTNSFITWMFAQLLLSLATSQIISQSPSLATWRAASMVTIILQMAWQPKLKISSLDLFSSIICDTTLQPPSVVNSVATSVLVASTLSNLSAVVTTDSSNTNSCIISNTRRCPFLSKNATAFDCSFIRLPTQPKHER
mmetsp:Transcript_25085/g.39869  ORF Transcript_25085/g.39869 Transcript_25085/m.39869 type:complete len:200 (+) Transcript_25085:914-1513(+)